jgi:flagellar hook-basal body complex protein FliE
MSIYTRKLFNRGGQVSSRGVGITSGLATPKRGYVDRPGSYQGKGEASLPDLKDTMSDRLQLLESLDLGRPEVPSKREILTPALLKFFGSLMSGKSYQEGLGGALDIAGQSLQTSAPDFAQAGTSIRKARSAQKDFDNSLKLKAFDMAYDEIQKAKDKQNEFVKGDFKTFYNKEDADDIITINTADSSSQIYNDPNFLKNYSLTKPDDDFVKGDVQTFYSKVNGNSITVNKNNPNSPLYKDKFFFNTYTDVKPDVPKAPNIEVFYNKNDDNETIEVDLNDRNSPYFTDPKFNETYTSVEPKDVKLKTVYFNPLNLPNDAKPSEKIKTAERKIVGNDISYTYNGEVYSESEFISKIGQNITEQLPLGITNTSLIASDRLLDTKEQIKTMYKEAHPEQSDLTENELDRLVALFVDQNKGTLYDVVKTTEFGTINELDSEFAKINKNRKSSVDNQNALGSIEQVLKGDIDIIDMVYGLDKADPSYGIFRAAAVSAYAELPAMSADDQDAVRASINALQDLKMIDPNQAIPLIGGPIGKFVEMFGINEETAKFLTGQRGLLLQSVDLLVKGIPSDFDVRNVQNTLPDLSVAASTNVLRIQRLDKFFKNIILNKVKFDLQTGKKIPMEMYQAAIAAGGDGIARELLQLQKSGGDPEMMDYINKMSIGVEGFTKQGFIEKFGDPFAIANEIVNTDAKVEFTPKKQEELDYFREKYGGNN